MRSLREARHNKQTHMKTEAYKLYSGGILKVLPNVIKIDPFILILSYNTVSKFVCFFWDTVYIMWWRKLLFSLTQTTFCHATWMHKAICTVASCLSVCPSNAGIEYRNSQNGKSLWTELNGVTRFLRVSMNWDVKYTDGCGNSPFSTEMSPYLSR